MRWRGRKCGGGGQEVVDILKTIKRGKTARHDRITPKILRHLGLMGTKLFTMIYKEALNRGKVPEDWRIVIIIPTLKKGDTK